MLSLTPAPFWCTLITHFTHIYTIHPSSFCILLCGRKTRQCSISSAWLHSIFPHWSSQIYILWLGYFLFILLLRKNGSTSYVFFFLTRTKSSLKHLHYFTVALVTVLAKKKNTLKWWQNRNEQKQRGLIS